MTHSLALFDVWGHLQRHLTIINLSFSVEHQESMARIKMFALLVLFRYVSLIQPLLGSTHILHYRWGSARWRQWTMGPALWYYSSYLVYLWVSAHTLRPKRTPLINHWQPAELHSLTHGLYHRPCLWKPELMFVMANGRTSKFRRDRLANGFVLLVV